MAQVTIEGSRTTPSTYLAAGDRITVELTPFVQKMIRSGYVVKVADIPDAAPVKKAKAAPKPKAAPEPEVIADGGDAEPVD